MTRIDREKCALRREFIYERAYWIIVQAEIAQRYCELADDAGLVYSTRRLAAELRLMLESMKEIEQARLASREAAD